VGKNESSNETANTEDKVFVLNATDKYTVLGLTGRMVYENSEIFAKDLISRIKGKMCYIVDVNGLNRIDSTGLGVLITFAKEVSAKDGQVGFAVKKEFLKEVFAIAKFEQVFPIADNPEEVWRLIADGYKSSLALKKY